MKRLLLSLLLVLTLLSPLVSCTKKSSLETLILESEKNRPTSSSASKPVAPRPSFTPADLTGTWESLRREGDVILLQTLTFHKDGTFDEHNINFCYFEEGELGESEGWHVPPMGFPYEGGDFTLSGKVITFVHNADYGYDSEEHGDPLIRMETVLELRDKQLVLDNRYGTYLLKEDDSDYYYDQDAFRALCERFGVSHTAP